MIRPSPRPRTLIVPGLDASPAPHWQHWWAATDPSATLIEQADWARPCVVQWETELAGALLAHPGAMLVGHSLGAVLIARVLTRWPGLKASGALLVAPADPGRSDRIAAFGPLPAAPLPVPAMVVASRNDPWMDFTASRRLAAAWGAAFRDMGQAGHINVESGFGPWPEGMRLRDRLLAPLPAMVAPHQRRLSPHAGLHPDRLA